MTSCDGCARPLWQRAQVFWLVCAILYLLLSCLDLYLTWLLVDRADLAYEANPLAAAILKDTGWLGLGAFKLGCVAFVLLVGLGLWRRRPRTARLLVGFGCLSSLVVVAYSVRILDGNEDQLTWRSQLAWAEARLQALRRAQRQQSAYRERLDLLAQDLVSGRRTLVEASVELSAFLREISHDPFYYLKRCYPNLAEEACLAAHLIRQVGFQVGENPDLARRQLHSLARQFAVYQAPLPELSSEPFAAATTWRGRRAAVQ